MKNKKKLVVSLTIAISVVIIGTTFAYSASLNEYTSSIPEVVMNPFEFIENCQASGGLVFSWDQGYGCDFPTDYDIICDNSGVCGEGFVTENTPQDSDVAGTIFDVGLHTNFSVESNPPIAQNEQPRKSKNEDKDEEEPPPSNRDILKKYCDENGGTFIDEANRWGCDLGNDEIVWCTETEPCHPDENESPDNNDQLSFGTMIPFDTTFLQLFILKPGNAQIGMLASSNRFYNKLASQAADGNSKSYVTQNDFGTFRLKSILGTLEFEGVMFNITQISYMLPDVEEQFPDSQANAQTVDIEPSEQALLTVSPKQDMNCRCGPGTSYDYQTTFRSNTEGAVLGKNTTGEWYFLGLEGGAQCWVWGNGLLDTSYLDDVEQISNTSTCSDYSDDDEGSSVPPTPEPPPPPACIPYPLPCENLPSDPPPVSTSPPSCPPGSSWNPAAGECQEIPIID